METLTLVYCVVMIVHIAVAIEIGLPLGCWRGVAMFLVMAALWPVTLTIIAWLTIRDTVRDRGH